MDFNEIKNSSRRNSVEKLYWFLQNPGKFSILLLGDSGVGKGHWVREIQREIKETTTCAEGIEEITLSAAEPNKAYWGDIFKKSHNKILLIKELEKVGNHDSFLFEALSTSNGKYGFDKKEVETRVIFSSSYSIQSLRETEQYITNRLFDRIAQLVVKFPSFNEANLSIWEDFEGTWKKMKFETHNELPKDKLEEWLNERSHTFNGNFRDLDKIAILWHQFRLMGVAEHEILSLVREQFLTYTAFPEHTQESGDAFYFSKGKTKREIELDFRATFKRWTKKTYGSFKKAAGPLEMNPRSMERW